MYLPVYTVLSILQMNLTMLNYGSNQIIPPFLKFFIKGIQYSSVMNHKLVGGQQQLVSLPGRVIL